MSMLTGTLKEKVCVVSDLKRLKSRRHLKEQLNWKKKESEFVA